MTQSATPTGYTADTRRYSFVIRCLHWGMAAGFVFMWASGYTIANLLAEDDPRLDTLIGLHMSVGVLTVLLLIVRIAARVLTARPPLPAAIAARERWLALLTHRAFYAGIAATAAAGWIMTNLYGYDVLLFGTALPRLVAARESLFGGAVYPAAGTVHAVFAYGLMALTALHVGAVIKHRVRDGIRLLPRIALLPVTSRPMRGPGDTRGTTQGERS